jgi:hypothetical protein
MNVFQNKIGKQDRNPWKHIQNCRHFFKWSSAVRAGIFCREEAGSMLRAKHGPRAHTIYLPLLQIVRLWISRLWQDDNTKDSMRMHKELHEHRMQYHCQMCAVQCSRVSDLQRHYNTRWRASPRRRVQYQERRGEAAFQPLLSVSQIGEGDGDSDGGGGSGLLICHYL